MTMSIRKTGRLESTHPNLTLYHQHQDDVWSRECRFWGSSSSTTHLDLILTLILIISLPSSGTREVEKGYFRRRWIWFWTVRRRRWAILSCLSPCSLSFWYSKSFQVNSDSRSRSLLVAFIDVAPKSKPQRAESPAGSASSPKDQQQDDDDEDEDADADADDDQADNYRQESSKKTQQREEEEEEDEERFVSAPRPEKEKRAGSDDEEYDAGESEKRKSKEKKKKKRSAEDGDGERQKWVDWVDGCLSIGSRCSVRLDRKEWNRWNRLESTSIFW